MGDKKRSVLLIYPGLRQSRNEGSKNRLYSFIEAYESAGFKVNVLAFVKDRAKAGKEASVKSSDTLVRWFRWPFIAPISYNRVSAHVVLWYMRLVVALFSWFLKPSVVQCEMYSVSNMKLCRRKGVVYVTDFHGDMFNEVVETGQKNKKHWFSKMLLALQTWSIKNSDVAICVSENLFHQLEINTGIQNFSSAIVSCSTDYARFEQATVADLGVDLSERLVVGYCGGLQKWQNIPEILRLVCRLRECDPRVFFCLFTGDDITPFKSSLSLIGEENYIIKALSFDEVPSNLKNLDAGLLIRDNFILNMVSSPTKIAEYLAAGAALICTPYAGDYKALTDDTTCFVVDDTDDFDASALLTWLWDYKSRHYVNVDVLTSHSFENQFKNFAFNYLNQ